jgi:hypothetical protein
MAKSRTGFSVPAVKNIVYPLRGRLSGAILTGLRRQILFAPPGRFSGDQHPGKYSPWKLACKIGGFPKTSVLGQAHRLPLFLFNIATPPRFYPGKPNPTICCPAFCRTTIFRTPHCRRQRAIGLKELCHEYATETEQGRGICPGIEPGNRTGYAGMPHAPGAEPPRPGRPGRRQ